MRSAILLVQLTLLVFSATSRLGVAGEFTLSATDVIVFAGEPVTLKLTLSYQGTAPIKILDSNRPLGNAAAIFAPAAWVPRRQPGEIPLGDGSMIMGERLLWPGEQISTTCPVSERYAVIPLGRASLTITLPVQPVGGTRIDVSTTCLVEILPARGKPQPSPPRVSNSFPLPSPSPRSSTVISRAHSSPSPSPVFRWPLAVVAGGIGLLLGFALAALLFRRRRAT